MKKLTPRQRLFVHEYLIDLNATQAARRARYKKPHVQGSRLLANISVAAAIAKAMKKREEKTGITQTRVLEELAIIGFSDLKNHLEINEDTGAIRAKSFEEMPGNSSRALEMIREDRMIREDSKGEDSIINEKVTFKLHSKIPALELLGKHLGMFKEPIDLKANVIYRIIYDKTQKAQKNGMPIG
jgi:phage terminase small subunit